MQPCYLYRLGLVSYETAWEIQKQLVAARKQGDAFPDVLLLGEHPPVYTLGNAADTRFVKFTPSQQHPPLVKTERGGNVTYHCPGQLIGYPILNLKHHSPDLHWYLRQLEAVIIRALGHLGLTGERLPGLTGVWVSGFKVAAIGIKVSRWITMHGFALNVCPDMSGFQQIVPCGIRDRPVGSLAQFLPELTLETVQPLVEASFAEIFGCTLIACNPAEVWPR